jgi:hypothetical protein
MDETVSPPGPGVVRRWGPQQAEALFRLGWLIGNALSGQKCMALPAAI